MPHGARPNFVVMIADDHREQSLGLAGNAEVETPNLDALGARATVFEQAHCQGGMHGAICVPSRATLMTGRHLFASTDDPTGRDATMTLAIPREMPTFPQRMREAGYRTHAIGKWHNDRASFARSFESGAQLMFGGMSDHDAVPVTPFDPNGDFAPETVRTAEGFSTDLFAEAAINFLQAQAGEVPFLLYVAFTAPHDPRTPPPGWEVDPATLTLPPNRLPAHPFDNGEMSGRDERLEAWPREPEAIRRHIADYYGMIAHLDHRIGDILATLDAQGLAENTVVVYCADHGLAVGQHGLLGKQNRYEHSTHVPLLIAGPGIGAGQRVPELVWHGDTTATLLELAGLDPAIAADGRSLVSALRGEVLEDWRRYLCGAYRYVQRSVRDERWKLIRYRSWPASDPAYPVAAGSDVVQLFDLDNDPWERVNLGWDPDLAEVRERLEVTLTAWQREVGDPALEPRS